MHYLQINIPVKDVSVQEILIAQFSALGYEGFEQEDSLLRAFIPEAQFDKAVLDELLAPWRLTWSTERLESRNWNEEWEKNFEPVTVGDFCGIRAHFHAPIPGVTHELLITPKMSFGTGHHATTFLMIQTMQELDFRDCRVVDLGTGTGILAILAEKLGASEILAIDNDDWSIENARENLLKNNATRVRVEKADHIALIHSSSDNKFDIILANINKHVILQQLHEIGQHLKEGGVLLLSGLLLEDESDIRKSAVSNNLPISAVITNGNWICFKAEKKSK